MEVEFSKSFMAVFARLSSSDQDKIDDFVEHVEKHDLDGVIGKLKNSDLVRRNDRNYMTKVAYARKYKLWHYHIGIPFYKDSKNPNEHGKISDYIVHFQRFPDKIKIIMLDNHGREFTLPGVSVMEKLNLI